MERREVKNDKGKAWLTMSDIPYKAQPEWMKEWEVDENGVLSNRKNGYWIAPYQFTDIDWIEHMSYKNWVDMNTFLPAFRFACLKAGYELKTIPTK